MAEDPRKPARTSAREQARKIHAEQERKQRRTSVLLRVGVIIVAVAIVAGLVFWVVNRNGNGDDAAAAEGPAPAVANEQGGFTVTAEGELVGGADMGTVDAEDVPGESDSDLPAGVVEREEGEKPHVVIYVDANCVHCASFEEENSDQLEQWVDEELITLEYRPVGFLDGNSGTNYSSRASNAFACMAEESPENYLDYVGSVVANQPNGELSDDELAAWAQDNYDVDISECISDGTYRAFASYTTAQAQAEGVSGTPTVYVDDVDWAESETPFQELAQSHIDEYEDEAS